LQITVWPGETRETHMGEMLLSWITPA